MRLMAALPFSFLLSLLILLISCSSTASQKPNASPKDLVQTLCAHASYPRICLRTLSSYPGPANSHRDLAQAAVKISLSRARIALGFLAKLRSQSKREQGALKDCVEQINESVDELCGTLSELQHLQMGGSGFRWQMSNAETWVSAALTNEDTCLDGFKETNGKVRSDVNRKITNVAKVTSNALYLINLLDDSRGKAAHVSYP